MASREARNQNKYHNYKPKKLIIVQPKKKVVKPKKVKRKPKIRFKIGNICLALLILVLLVISLNYLIHLPIKHIYIIDNGGLADQTIIDEAGLTNYPSILSVYLTNIKAKLEKDILIKEAVVQKKFFTIEITIIPNYCLFYDTNTNSCLMADLTEASDHYSSPTLINYIPDSEYDAFITSLATIDQTIISRISEIKYDPDDVDSSRFLLSMSDGNYVYVTTSKLTALNDYVDIIKEFPNQKGILYLDSGNTFKVLEKK